jgi:hypothetical protein
MNRLYARWQALPGDERRLLLGLVAALPVIAALVRVLGAVRTARLLERTSGGTPTRCRADAAEMQAAQRLAALAAIAGRRGAITATCLRQALLVHWLLRRRGFSPELRLGVRKQADAVDAHAWVELQGVALGQTRLAHLPFPGRGLSAPLAD